MAPGKLGTRSAERSGSIIPHLDAEGHEAAAMANAEKWASKLPVPVYVIDDQTAIKFVDGQVEVVSEGNWKLFKH